MAAREVLQSVLDRAHRGHEYRTDKELYDKREHWTVNLEGDCEDFALWCRRELVKQGIESDLVFCKTESGAYHLVCSVDGWILDNRHDWIMSRDDLPYEWMKIGLPDGTWHEISD